MVDDCTCRLFFAGPKEACRGGVWGFVRDWGIGKFGAALDLGRCREPLWDVWRELNIVVTHEQSDGDGEFLETVLFPTHTDSPLSGYGCDRWCDVRLLVSFFPRYCL